jgi:hypothetical protein
VPAGFGNGPKVRWQNVQNCLSLLKLEAKYLRHGLSRDVYLFRHVQNLESVAQTGAIPQPFDLSVSGYSAFWKERWAIPRASRIVHSTNRQGTVENLAESIENK